MLFVLQEAQRFDVSCVAYEEDCELATRATNRLLPDRFPLLADHGPPDYPAFAPWPFPFPFPFAGG